MHGLFFSFAIYILLLLPDLILYNAFIFLLLFSLFFFFPPLSVGHVGLDLTQVYIVIIIMYQKKEQSG